MARAVFFAVAAVGLLVGPATAATFVKPGDTGSITWVVENDAQSGGPMTGVTVSVTAPAHFVKNPGSQLDPVASIAPGDSHTFQLDYTISSDATDGETLDVTLRTNQDTEYVTNRNVETSVRFNVGDAPPIITPIETVIIDVGGDSCA